MRHARQVDDYGFTADGLAETERQFGRALVVVQAGEQFAQVDFFARRVGQLYADRIAARYDRDARRDCAHGTGDVVSKPDHARGFDAGSRFKLVERDHRPRTRVYDFPAHPKVLQHAFQCHGIAIDDVARQSGTLAGARRGQEIERGQRVATSGATCRRS